MKKNAIIAAIASLALVFGVTGTAVMLNGDKAITETSTSVVEGDSSTDNQSGNTDKAGDEKSESDSGEVAKSEDTTDKDEDREDADTTEKDSASTTNKNSGKSGVATAASTPAPAESDAGSAQISGGTDSKVTTPRTDSSEQNQSSSEDTAQNPDGGSDSGSDGEEDKTPHTDISPADVVRLTNDERVKNGLEALETETAIQDAANIRAKEIATNFSHTRPDGTSFSTAISGKYSHTGENIAYSTGNVTAEKFVSMWMASSGHKANILGDYTGIAVGIYYDENSDTTYAVQLFVSDEEDSQYTYTDTVVPPTCTEQGYTLHTCNEDASKSYKDNYIDALGHDYGDGVVTTPATCTESGVKTYTCSRCGDTTTEIIKATGHQTEVQNAKEAICTEDGYTGDTVCTVCGETVTKGEVIKATGHQTEVQNAKEATCTEDGYTGDTVCTVCGETVAKGEVIKATGHKTEVQNAKPATCTEDGYTGDTVCTVCGETVAKGEIIKATGHNFVDGSCTICGAEDPDYNPEPEYTYTVSVVEPTCTEQGYTLHTCNEDASKTYKDNYTAALGHDWDGANLGATCRRCGTPLFVFDHTVDATCQDGGYDVYVSVADPSQTRMTNFTDPIDHIYENGFCIMCGEEEPDIPNYDDNYDKGYYNNTIISLTNQARESRGLSSLRYASEYQAAADIRAQEIVSNFSHTRPNGSGPETTLDELGCEYSSVGENIAYVSSMYKPNKIVENWLASPGHASNMLSSTFDSFVVGTACSDGRVYAVQLFFTDASADANSVQTMTLDEAEAVDEEAPAASESAEDIVPAPTEEPIELPEETTAPDEELEETAEETPSPVETPAPEVTPSPEPSTEPTPAPTPEAPTVTDEPAVPEEVAPIETPAPEATPEPTEEPADAAPEESPIQEQDVITPPEETELVVPQMEEIPDDTPADTAE